MTDIHFRSFTAYSCGDTIGKPQTDNLADVTCQTCRCEYARLAGPVKWTPLDAPTEPGRDAMTVTYTA